LRGEARNINFQIKSLYINLTAGIEPARRIHLNGQALLGSRRRIAKDDLRAPLYSDRPRDQLVPRSSPPFLLRSCPEPRWSCFHRRFMTDEGGGEVLAQARFELGSCERASKSVRDGFSRGTVRDHPSRRPPTLSWIKFFCCLPCDSTGLFRQGDVRELPCQRSLEVPEVAIARAREEPSDRPDRCRGEQSQSASSRFNLHRQHSA
jgi:hypothetical protein